MAVPPIVQAAYNPPSKRSHVTAADRTLSRFSGQPAKRQVTHADRVLSASQTAHNGGGYEQLARQDAARYGIPPDIFEAQIQQESGFNPNAHSSAGAEGIAQFMPQTAAGFHIDPMNPVQALDAAARYDSNLLHKYGPIERALSAYNSGRPDAYQDPNFAGGQTFNYVRSILGSSAGTHPAATGQHMAPSTMAPAAAGTSPLIRALLSGIDEKGQITPQGILAAVQAGSGSQAEPMMSAPSQAAPAQTGSRKMTALDGIMVDPAIAGEVQSVVNRFGVHPTSGYRSPAHNAQVGGATHSDHLSGDAVDFAGSPQAMQALYKFAQGRFPYTEPMAQAKNHVHISFRR